MCYGPSGRIGRSAICDNCLQILHPLASRQVSWPHRDKASYYASSPALPWCRRSENASDYSSRQKWCPEYEAGLF